MRAKRDYAMLAMLFGCGFRRSELVGLELDDIQMRQGHWAVVDLVGKGGPHSNCPDSRVGQSRSRPVDMRSQCYGGQNLSSSRPDGKGVGSWDLAERCVVRGEDMLRESRLRTHCTARSPQDLCEAVPRPRR